MIRTIYLSYFLLFIFFGCNESHKKQNSIISEKYNAKIDLIDSLKFYSIEKGWIQKSPQYNVKIITYINAECEDCVYELLTWKKLINEWKDEKVCFLFYIKPRNINLLAEALTYIDFKYPVIIDYGGYFYKKNKLNLDKMFQTFLVDTENKIILIGNPTYNDNIKKVYIKTIKKINNP